MDSTNVDPHGTSEEGLPLELSDWFVTAILPHEPALMRYLKRACRSISEISDLRQDTYVRVYESARKSRPRLPKTFLFTTARNLIIDKYRRQRVVTIDYTEDTNTIDFPTDELTPERRLICRQDLQALARAFATLPKRTQSVIWLRRVVGLSQRQAATTLGIDEGALEGHMVRGLQNLAKALDKESGPSGRSHGWDKRSNESPPALSHGKPRGKEARTSNAP